MEFAKNLKTLSFSLLLILSFCSAEISEIELETPEAIESNELKGNIYSLIAKENLKSLSTPKEQGGFNALMKEYKRLGFKGLIKSQLKYQMNPDEDDKQRLVLKLLSVYYDKTLEHKSDIIDEVTWQDLNILCGPKSNTRMHLASKITSGRTITTTGVAAVFRKLVQPTCDINELEKQQAITKELVENEKLFNELDEKLKELVIPENILLSFWNPEDNFSNYIEWEPCKCRIFLENKVKFLKKYSNWLNKKPFLLECYSRYKELFGYVGKFFMTYGAIALPIDIIFDYNIFPKISLESFKKISPTSASGALSLAVGLFVSEKSLGKIKSSLSAWNNEKGTIEEIIHFEENNVLFKYVHKKISYLAKYINNLKDIEILIAQYPELIEKMPALQSFSKLLTEFEEKSSDFKFLIKLLETKTIKSKYSYFEFFSRVTVAYRLMQEQKEKFIPAMLAIGELDAQLTIAKLYKEFQNKGNRFCFPEFIENSEGPRVSAQNFWNPFLDTEKAVSSSIDIGCYDFPQNVIITGPNAGGKSTITKAIVLGFILGQSLGIAPAKTLSFTPASTIMTYLNITDDIAAENSHFEAGVIRAGQLLDASKKLVDGQFGIFAVDEVFNGTTYKAGQAAAFTLIEELGDNPNLICITNTHFPLITSLEEAGLFCNYKVSVIDTVGEKIVYPYKLEPGISNQNVALKILEEKGFNQNFIRKAQRYV